MRRRASDKERRIVVESSGGLGREINPVLRVLALFGAELVLPLITEQYLGSGLVRGIGKVTALTASARQHAGAYAARQDRPAAAASCG